MSCMNEGTHHFACDCREQHFQDLTRRMNDLEDMMKSLSRALDNRVDHDIIKKALHDSLKTIHLIPSQYHL